MEGIDRHWLFTWTTYGQWLPGDPRGSVTRIRDRSGPRHEHDLPGTPYDENLPGLYESAMKRMKGPPIRFTKLHADHLLPQFQETADYRRWLLVGTAVMANHVHLAVGVSGDPPPEEILADFKSYGSRALNRHFPKPKSETWWTTSGSKRKLKQEDAVLRAVAYLRRQEYPLLIWINPVCDQWLR